MKTKAEEGRGEAAEAEGTKEAAARRRGREEGGGARGGGAAGATGTPGGRRNRCTSVKTKFPRRCEDGGGERKGVPAV